MSKELWSAVDAYYADLLVHRAGLSSAGAMSMVYESAGADDTVTSDVAPDAFPTEPPAPV